MTKCPNFGQSVRTWDRVFELGTECSNLGQKVRTLNRVSKLWTECLNFRQSIRTLDSASWTECPNFEQSVRILDRVSELWTECPNFGQSVRTLDRVSELWTVCPNLWHTTLYYFRFCFRNPNFCPDPGSPNSNHMHNKRDVSSSFVFGGKFQREISWYKTQNPYN